MCKQTNGAHQKFEQIFKNSFELVPVLWSLIHKAHLRIWCKFWTFSLAKYIQFYVIKWVNFWNYIDSLAFKETSAQWLDCNTNNNTTKKIIGTVLTSHVFPSSQGTLLLLLGTEIKIVTSTTFKITNGPITFPYNSLIWGVLVLFTKTSFTYLTTLILRQLI